MSPQWAVVVPTIREDCLKRFLDEWRDDLCGARIIVVEDNPERSFDAGGADHYSHAEIDRDLGEDSWIIPRRSSAIRSYGTLIAVRGGAEFIWHLDDDCYPEPGRRGSYLTELRDILTALAPPASWWNTLDGIYPRGYPYGIRAAERPVMAHHGLWSNVPDLDGRTQLAMPGFRLPPAEHAEHVPPGLFFPMCGMNLAFRGEAARLFYMLLMGRSQAGTPFPFDRFDDMWAGLLVKRIMDHLGWAVTSGAPSVEHSRASDAERNARIEAPGIEAHERLWPVIAGADLTGSDAADCYRQLSAVVAGFGDGYWPLLGAAMTRWADLW